MKKFKDRVAVVTGAASGISFAMADRFGSVGMKVVLADIEDEPLERARAQLAAKGAPVLAVHTDVSDAGDVESLGQGHHFPGTPRGDERDRGGLTGLTT